ncbi:hypothetical protein F5Y18DRAFT_409841 [Xylariaceae sp. FL1019]|nr:hypothetical protein F5Y18DRAFT_409841 [Xylariaceae sp. FL1019]
MAPAQKAKTDFKTYESATRLLAAVIATTGCKLDFKELARHVGGRATKDSINHRLRPIKHLAKLQIRALEQNQDPGDLPVETQEIHRMFGESTPQGLEWQFRDIKSLAKAQKEAADKNEDVSALSIGNAGKGGKGAVKKGAVAGEKAAATPKKGGAGVKRKRAGTKKDFDDTTSEEAIELDDDSDEPTPKRPTSNKKTKAATATAIATSTAATTPTAVKQPNMQTQASLPTASAPPVTSMFGDGHNRLATSAADDNFDINSMFPHPSGASRAVKQEPSGATQHLSYDHVRNMMDMDGLEDGEI